MAELPTITVSDGSQFSARWRILAWLLVTAAIGLGAMVITVNGVLEARVGHTTNDELAQEVREFRRFAAEGRDPETAGPFSSVDRLLEVYLRRQQPSGGELLIGWVEGRPDIWEISGPNLPQAGRYHLPQDVEAMRRIQESPNGVMNTPAGELRWARQDVQTPDGQRGYLVASRFTEPAYQEVGSITQTMTMVALGTLALTALIGWLVAGRILRPIRTMQRSVEKISQQDLSRRIPVQGRDDLAELATTFNAMLDRLERSFSGEQRFVEDASRELLRPVAGVRSRLHSLSEGADSDQQPYLVAEAVSELDQIDGVLTDLSVLAQAERPDFVRIDEAVDIRQLTLQVAESVQATAPRHWVLREAAEGTAQIDPGRVAQAIRQLVDNAVQHTGDGDQITLASRWDVDDEGKEIIRFTVSDTGPGVHPDDAEAIFERFTRGSQRRTRSGRPGAGLGLAIVRAIADGHGGWVFVDSIMGHGATFGLALPRTAVVLDPDHLDDHDRDDADTDEPGDDRGDAGAGGQRRVLATIGSGMTRVHTVLREAWTQRRKLRTASDAS